MESWNKQTYQLKTHNKYKKKYSLKHIIKAVKMKK